MILLLSTRTASEPTASLISVNGSEGTLSITEPEFVVIDTVEPVIAETNPRVELPPGTVKLISTPTAGLVLFTTLTLAVEPLVIVAPMFVEFKMDAVVGMT
jgi:hypothetical protein